MTVTRIDVLAVSCPDAACEAQPEEVCFCGPHEGEQAEERCVCGCVADSHIGDYGTCGVRGCGCSGYAPGRPEGGHTNG